MSAYTQWVEGHQLISFPNEWMIIKLDGHKYYKRISGLGVKAVDFIALDPDWGLYLIELKDYPTTATIPNYEAHGEMLNSKLKGSIRVIRTVNAALRRQWYYRLIFLRLGIHRWCPNEWRIWKLAEECIENERFVIIGDFSCA